MILRQYIAIDLAALQLNIYKWIILKLLFLSFIAEKKKTSEVPDMHFIYSSRRYQSSSCHLYPMDTENRFLHFSF